jgi:hypothetical protein
LATGIVDNGAGVAEDSLSIPIYSLDSIGTPQAIAAGDSVGNDASITSGAWEDWAGASFYNYKEGVDNLDGTANEGVYSYVIVVDDVSLGLETIITGNFQLYDSETLSEALDAVDNVASVDADAIGAGDFATGAIDADAIASSAIGADEIATNAIGALEIATDAIASNEIAADAIGSTELATNAADEIADEVWDELVAGHTTANTFGDTIVQIIEDGGIAINETAIDNIWDEDSTGHWTSPNMAFVAGQTSAGGLDSTIISNLLHRIVWGTAVGSGSDSSTAAQRDIGIVAASIIDLIWDEDSTGHWTSPNMAFIAGQTSASALDSAIISNILHRIVWGTAVGSGSDSSTAAQRDVGAANITEVGGDAITDNNDGRLEVNVEEWIDVAPAALVNAGGQNLVEVNVQAFSESADAADSAELVFLRADHSNMDQAISSLSDITLSGTADSGSATMIALNGGVATNEYYNGQMVLITGGAGIGQSRTILSYLGSNKVATVTRDWATAPDNTSTFKVIAGDVPGILEAGTAAAGAVGTITLDATASDVTDTYKDNFVMITGGTGLGQTRLIGAYNGGTHVATVTPNWTTTPDNTTCGHSWLAWTRSYAVFQQQTRCQCLRDFG